MTVPYVITTMRPVNLGTSLFEVASRRAVATLEDACAPYALPPEGREESMEERVDRATTYDYLRLWVEGSAPRVLLDGTLIEVAPLTEGELLAAYNALERSRGH